MTQLHNLDQVDLVARLDGLMTWLLGLDNSVYKLYTGS